MNKGVIIDRKNKLLSSAEIIDSETTIFDNKNYSCYKYTIDQKIINLHLFDIENFILRENVNNNELLVQELSSYENINIGQLNFYDKVEDQIYRQLFKLCTHTFTHIYSSVPYFKLCNSKDAWRQFIFLLTDQTLVLFFNRQVPYIFNIDQANLDIDGLMIDIMSRYKELNQSQQINIDLQQMVDSYQAEENLKKLKIEKQKDEAKQKKLQEEADTNRIRAAEVEKQRLKQEKQRLQNQITGIIAVNNQKIKQINIILNGTLFIIVMTMVVILGDYSEERMN